MAVIRIIGLALGLLTPCWPEGYEWLAGIEIPPSAIVWSGVARSETPGVGIPLAVATIRPERPPDSPDERLPLLALVVARGTTLVAIDTDAEASRSWVYLRDDMVTPEGLIREAPTGACGWSRRELGR